MSYESLLSSAAEESTDEGTTEVETESTVIDEGQAPEENPESIEGEQVDPKNVLEQIAKEEQASGKEGNEFVEKLNALNMIHNGAPIKLESVEQLKELVQKGYDYTKKTMSHAEEVKTKTEEFAQKEAAIAQREQEIQSTIFDNQIMEKLLLKWKGSDPELFNYLAQSYQQEVSAFEMQKPFLAQYENQFKQLNEKFAQLEQGKQKEELGKIKQGWESELNDLQTRMAAPLAKIGVKADWEKVKAAWSADASNKMSVEDALYAVHGKDIMKANESYQKMLSTKAKTQAKMLSRSGVSGNSSAKGEAIKVAPGNYEELLKVAASGM